MSSYTVSKLAQDAGVSVVRDYVLRGLLRPAGHTEGGYGLYDAHALERLRLVRTLIAARRKALAVLDRQLAEMVAGTRRCNEAEPHYG